MIGMVRRAMAATRFQMAIAIIVGAYLCLALWSVASADNKSSNAIIALCTLILAVVAIIVSTMGLKPSPSGESLRFIYWRDGELPHWGA